MDTERTQRVDESALDYRTIPALQLKHRCCGCAARSASQNAQYYMQYYLRFLLSSLYFSLCRIGTLGNCAVLSLTFFLFLFDATSAASSNVMVCVSLMITPIMQF